MSVMKQQKFVPIDIDALRRQFDYFDKDGSGFLEPGEAVAALTMIGSKLKFEDLDTDGDNRISFDEVRVAPKTAEVLCAPGSERSSSYEPSGLRFSVPPSCSKRTTPTRSGGWLNH